jgi:hypothetical protein
MVIPASGKERGAAAHSLRDLKAQDAIVKINRTLQVGHLEMHVTNTRLRMDRLGHPDILLPAVKIM